MWNIIRSEILNISDKELAYYNSHDLYYKHPFGAVKCCSDVCIRIKVKENISEVFINILSNDIKRKYKMAYEKKDGEYTIYSKCFTISQEPTLVFYYFSFIDKGKVYYYGNNNSKFGGKGKLYNDLPLYYQLTVYDKDINTPDWFKNSIAYQIFPDRFNNSDEECKVSNPKKNSFIYGSWYDKPIYIKDVDTGSILRWDFFGGNIQGIIEKLDYLQDLGVSLIYLNPIFESASNHRYDTGNYKKIDPILGDKQGFKKLVEEAKKRNIYIILDGVFNHTGSDSVYFNKDNNYNSVGAYQSKESPYFAWYNFTKHPDEYECWWGVDTLPSINELHPTYLDYIIRDKESVINYWMNFGIKGWRLDVADELPDEFIKELKDKVLENDNEAILIGEVWEDASNKISYNKRRKYIIENSLDSVTNYLFRKNMISFLSGDIDAKELKNSFLSIYENYPKQIFYSLLNIISSHDIERIMTSLDNIVIQRDISQGKLYNITFKLLKIITTIQYTFPGVPLLYYGDETGLKGGKDPSNRACYPWGREDTRIMSWYKSLIKIRNNNIVFRTGEFEQLRINADVYGLIRSIKYNSDVFGKPVKQNSIAIVLINRSNNSYQIKIDMNEYDIDILKRLIDKKEKYKIKNNILKLKIDSLESIILIS